MSRFRKGLWGFLCVVGLSGLAAAADVSLLNVSYDPTRELYTAVNQALRGFLGEEPWRRESHREPVPRRLG